MIKSNTTNGDFLLTASFRSHRLESASSQSLHCLPENEELSSSSNCTSGIRMAGKMCRARIDRGFKFATRLRHSIYQAEDWILTYGTGVTCLLLRKFVIVTTPKTAHSQNRCASLSAQCSLIAIVHITVVVPCHRGGLSEP